MKPSEIQPETDRGTQASSSSGVFLAELARFGPDSSTDWSLAECEKYCQKWATQSYENFTVVSWLLPRALRQHFYNVYTYCRWSDNLADEIESDTESLRLLEWWEGELDKCSGGQPEHPVMRAVQATIESLTLSDEPFRNLLSAFRQDRMVNRYSTNEELLDYCRRSADPVGRILLAMARSDTAENVELSDRVCTGLQIANFCQDMARDAAMGRIYAPRSLWQKHLVTEEMLLGQQSGPQLKVLLADWVATTHEYFQEGWPLVHRVPKWLATDIELFIRGGTEILNQIAVSNYDVWTQRPTVTKSRKLRLVSQAFTGRLFGRAKTLTRNWGAKPLRSSV